MKILAFYFSGTGNTWWLLDQFRTIAQEAGHIMTMYSIPQIHTEDWDQISQEWHNADYIGFAHPVYGSDAPKIIRQFVAQLPDHIPNGESPTKPAFVFTTMDLFSGDGGVMMRKEITKADLDLRVVHNFRMVANLGMPLFNYGPCTDAKFAARRERTLKKLRTVAEYIFAQKKHIQIQWGLVGIALGALQRLFMHSIEKRSWNWLGIDDTRCTQCLSCVKNCPTQAIKYADGHFEFTSLCTSCFRCYNFCPTQAITISGRSANPKHHRQHKTYRGKPFY